MQRSDSLGDGVVVATAVWAGLGFALHLPCLLALSEASGPTVHRPGTSSAAIYLLVHISLFSLSKSPLLSRLDLSFLPFPVRPTPQFLRTAPSTRKGSGSVQRNKFSSTWADLSSAPGFDCIHTFKVFVNLRVTATTSLPQYSKPIYTNLGTWYPQVISHCQRPRRHHNSSLRLGAPVPDVDIACAGTAAGAGWCC